jgi:hypothetical protein
MIDLYRQRMRAIPARRRWLTVTGIVAAFFAVIAFLIGLAFGDGILGAILFGLIFGIVVALVWAALTYRLERRG